MLQTNLTQLSDFQLKLCLPGSEYGNTMTKKPHGVKIKMFIAMVGSGRHHLKAIITGFKLLQVCLHPAQATCHTPLSLVMWKKAKYITHNKGTVMQCLRLTHFCWYYRLHGNVMVLTDRSHLRVPC